MVFESTMNNGSAIATRPLFRWENAGSHKMVMIANGNVGINTLAPNGRLDVGGTLFADLSFDNSAPSQVLYDATTDEIFDGGTSTIHFKENIDDLTFNKDSLLNLRPVSFNWKSARGGKADVGLIAQEVNQTFPDLAYSGPKMTYFPDGSVLRDSTGSPVVDTTQAEVWGVRYHKLPVYLLAIVKDQEAKISSLTSQVEELTQIVNGCCDLGQQSRLSGNSGNNNSSANEISISEEFVLLQNDPNPFSDYTDIQFKASSCRKCEIVIIDLNGKLIKRIGTNGKAGRVRVYCSEIGNGVFSYSLVSNGQVLKTQKLVSTK